MEKKAIMGLINCVRAINIAVNLRDQNKIAGSWWILGLETQRALGALEAISRKNKTVGAFIKQHLELPQVQPQNKEEVKAYTG